MFGDCFVNYKMGVDFNKPIYNTADTFTNNLYVDNKITSDSITVGQPSSYTATTDLTNYSTQTILTNTAIFRPQATTNDAFSNERNKLVIDTSLASIQSSNTNSIYNPTLNCQSNQLYITGVSSIGCVASNTNFALANLSTSPLFSVNGSSNYLEIGDYQTGSIQYARAQTNSAYNHGPSGVNNINNLVACSNLVSNNGPKVANIVSTSEFYLGNYQSLTTGNGIMMINENYSSIQNLCGVKISNINYAGSTITNNYLLKLENTNSGTITNNYMIHCGGGSSSNNYFEGNIRCNNFTTNNILSSNIDNTGYLRITGASTLQSTLYVKNATTVASTLNTTGLITSPAINFGKNNLSYYEEGTFIATFVNPLSSGTSVTQSNCSFTRIGRCMYISVKFIYKYE
jgi:hypothetical protein